MWFIFALLSAALSSFRKVNDKTLSHDVHHLHLAWMSRAATLPISAVVAIASGNFLIDQALSPAFFMSLIISSVITGPLDMAVYLQSLKHGQLSKTAPLLSLYPALMLLTGAVFLGQIPTFSAVAAVLVIVVGVYALNTSRGNNRVLQNIWTNRGTKFGLLGVLTISLHMTVSSIAVLESSPLFYAFWAALASATVQFMYAYLFASGKWRDAPKLMIAKNGTVQGLSGIFYFCAISVGPLAYVTAIRSLSVIFSALYGAKKFNEVIDSRKVLALTLITIGALTLSLSQ